MSTPPQPPKEMIFPHIDIFEHVAEYFILGFLLFYSIVKSKKQYFRINAFELSAIIGVLYSFTDELHQYFVPNRVIAIEDILADGLGVLWGALIAVAFLVYLESVREKNEITTA
jgi:VanZ family protein